MDHLRRELALRLEQLIDSLLERPHANETVHEHRLVLTDAMHAVGRLLLDRRVPPAVEMDHVVRRRQVQPATPSLDRDDEDRRPFGGLERAQDVVALPRGQPAVEEPDLLAELLRDIPDEPAAAWVLRQDERFAA